MKIRRRISVIALLALWLCFGAVNAFAATDTGDIGGRIERFVAEHSDTTAGMAVAVFDSENTLYTGCFGFTDIESGVATDALSVFEWGSATKLLVWSSVMQLYEQGRIDLQADVRQYLPEGFLRNLHFDAPVTMIHLMNHNAGFQEMLWDVFSSDENAIPELGELLSKRQPEQIYEPGTVTAYSNWGVALAGYIVERVSGQPLYEYVSRHIFDPLGMKYTSLKPDYSDNPYVRKQWDRLVCYTTECRKLEPSRYFIPLYPAGSCVSTIGDFLLFAQALLNRDSALFRSPATHDLLFEPTLYYDGTGIPRCCHGLWMIPYGKPVYGHGGNTAGCSSCILLSPADDVGMVVMTNQSGEEIYNCQMPELVFGRFDELSYFRQKRDIPQGIYRPARTVLRGPIRLYNLSFLGFDETSREDFWTQNTRTGTVYAPYGDYIRTDAWLVNYEFAILGLWGISVAAAPVTLIVMLVCLLRRRESRPAGKWVAAALLLRLLLVVIIVYVVMSGLAYRPSCTFAWCFPVIAVIAAGLAALAVMILLTLERQGQSMKKGTIAARVMTLAGIFITLINLVYWQMFLPL